MSGSPSAAAGTPVESSQAAADQIRDVEQARLRSLVEGDIELAERFHAPDFQLITPRGRTLSRREYMAAIASGGIRYLSWTPGPMEVRVHVGAAVIRYRAELRMPSATGQDSVFECWHTDTYEQHDGQWRVVWSQATRIE